MRILNVLLFTPVFFDEGFVMSLRFPSMTTEVEAKVVIFDFISVVICSMSRWFVVIISNMIVLPLMPEAWLKFFLDSKWFWEIWLVFLFNWVVVRMIRLVLFFNCVVFWVVWFEFLLDCEVLRVVWLEFLLDCEVLWIIWLVFFLDSKVLLFRS